MTTRFLIVVNVIVFIWEIATLGTGILSGNVDVNGLVRDGALVPIAVTQYHEYWRIFTSAFLHGSILHIAVNMYSLYVLGRFMEAALGSPRMLFIYMVSLVASGLGVVYLSSPNVATLGASGAIFGLFGALFAIGLKFGPRGMDLVKANIPILLVNLIFTFAVPGISWQAHVSGLLAGFIITFAIYFPPKRIRPEVVDAGSGSALDSEYEPAPENVTQSRG
ncbi:MAG TPA: rhomboid family intramembrane serine protease [Candidatus Tyrphobacter sp.]